MSREGAREGRYIPLSRRFTFAFAVVALGLVAIMASILEGRVRSLLQEQARARAEAVVRSIAGSATRHLLAYDYIALQGIARAARQQDSDILRVVIHDKEGRVAGHTLDGSLLGRVLRDSSSVRAKSSGSLRTEEGLFDLQGKMIHVLHVSLPVLTEGARWGTVEIDFSMEALRGEISLMRTILIIMAIVGVLLGTLAAHLLSLRITRPIGKLVAASRNLAEGRWDASWSLETGDEIGILAGAFRDAAQQLTEHQRDLELAQEELRLLNAGLEETVQLRTRELHESRELYRLLVENAPDPFVLVRNEEVLFANSAFEELFGPIEKRGEKRRRFGGIIHPDFRDQMDRIVRQGMETDDPISGEVQGISTSGAPVELEVRGRRVLYRKKEALELILVDVTQRRRLLRQLVQSERLRAMGEVTAMVAHNFNNILAVIVARVQFLSSRLKDRIVVKSLNTIENAAQRGAGLVRKIQEFYGDQADLHFTDVCVNAMVREVVEYVKNYWKVARGEETRMIDVEVNLQPTPFVWGAEPLLQDALKRILLNAAEAMPSGGTVRVSTDVSGEHITIKVEDEGPGMEAEVLRRAFDPFFSTKGSNLRGLGLSAALGIIQRHQGSIELSSEPGRGTLVTVTLRASQEKHRLVGRKSGSKRLKAA